MGRYHREDDDDILAQMRCVDSMFGTTLFLTEDGRKRGLWVWIEDEINARLRTDTRMFDTGFERFVAYVKEKKIDFSDEKQVGDLRFHMRCLFFDYFFGHRTEGQAVRLGWAQAKRLAAAITKGIADEKDKTKEDGYNDEEEE